MKFIWQVFPSHSIHKYKSTQVKIRDLIEKWLLVFSFHIHGPANLVVGWICHDGMLCKLHPTPYS